MPSVYFWPGTSGSNRRLRLFPTKTAIEGNLVNQITRLFHWLQACRLRRAYFLYLRENVWSRSGEFAYIANHETPLVAMTYPTTKEALAHISSNHAEWAVNYVETTFGFGPAQQAFAFYYMNNRGFFDSQAAYDEVADRVAAGNPVWRQWLTEQKVVGPLRLRNA